MYLLKIAFRNLFRRKYRTFLIAGMLATAIIVFLSIDAFMLGMMDASFGNIIDFETPHIEIAQTEFFDDDPSKGFELPLSAAFTPDKEMIQSIQKLPEFVATTKVLDFSASFVGPYDDYPVRVRAIEPETFNSLFKTADYITQGEFITSQSSGLIVGDQLAELFELEVGSHYTLLFRDSRDSFSTLEGKIAAIVSTPHPDVNRNYVLVCIDFARRHLGFNNDEISQIMVRLSDRVYAEDYTNLLNRSFKQDNKNNFLAQSYRESSELLNSLETWGYIETYFILGLILIVGSIGIINLVLLSAIERTSEIGMMKAMGLTKLQIVKIFLYESMGVGIIGGLGGCIASVIIIIMLRHYGLDLHSLYHGAEQSIGLPVTGKIYGVFNPQAFALIFSFVIVLSMLASIIPSWQAAGKDPVIAIYKK